MAYYGLSNPVVAKYNVMEGVETYTEGFRCGKAIGTDVTPSYNEAKLFADNQLAEYVKEFKEADVNLTVSTLPLVAETVILGHAASTEEIAYKAADQSNYCGYGFYASEMTNGKSTYIGCWLPKVKFTESGDAYTTKGDSIEFKNPTLNGKASPNLKGDWKIKKTFATESEVETWLKEKAGMNTENQPITQTVAKTTTSK